MLDIAYQRNRAISDDIQNQSENILKALTEYNEIVIQLERESMEMSGGNRGVFRKKSKPLAETPAEVESTVASPKPVVSAKGMMDSTTGPAPTDTSAEPVAFAPSENDLKAAEERRLNDALGNLEKDREYKHQLTHDVLLPEHEDVIKELSEDEYTRLYETINTGMMNSGLVLSQLLGVSVEVSVPELKLVKPSELISYLPNDDIISVWLDTEGDFESVLLLVFDENTGYKAAGDLMGLPREDWNKEHIPEDDLQSVLSELTNIVGANLLNALANTAGRKIMPSVPTFIVGDSQNIARKLESIENSKEKYRVIYISADFFREDMELLGRLFLFLPHKSLIELIKV